MSAPPLVLNPVLHPPGNETPEHFLLKQVARVYLKMCRGCQIVGTEVPGMEDYYLRGKQRCVADAVGVGKRHVSRRGPDGKYTCESKYTVFCVEAKQSMSDLKNGFAVGGDLNYIIGPKGLFRPSDIRDGVGLIEVDFDSLCFTLSGLSGVVVTKKATRTVRSRYPFSRDDRDAWVRDTVERIAMKETNDAVFRGTWFYPGFPPSKFNRREEAH